MVCYVITSLVIAIRHSGPDFYKITIADIASILTSLLTGAGVVYYVSVALGRKQKKADFLCARIESLIDSVYKDIMNSFEGCFGKEVDGRSQHRLNILFRIASNELNSLKLAFGKDGAIPRETLEQKIQSVIELQTKLKGAITDAPYSAGHVVCLEDENQAISVHEKIKNELNDLKLTLHQ